MNKSQFLFTALPLTALVAPAFAVTYLSAEQAQKEIFPGKTFTAMPLKLSADQRQANRTAKSRATLAR